MKKNPFRPRCFLACGESGFHRLLLLFPASRRPFLCLAALCAACALPVRASGASAYVVPWYANPVATNEAFRLERTACLAEDSAPVSNAWETVRGSAVLAGKTPVARRMSHSDDFRPRLNVLCDDGAVAVFTLTKELDAVKWTTVVSNDVLCAAADVPAGSVATDLQVRDDGAFAFLKYGSEWKVLGYDPPHWTLHVVDTNGVPPADATAARNIWNSTYQTDPAQILGLAYVTDGKWKFECHRNTWGQIAIGNNNATDQQHIIGNLNDYSAEYLDLSRGVATLADIPGGQLDNLSELPIRNNYKGAFADRMRVYVESRNQTAWYNSRGVWKGVEEAVQTSSAATSLGYLSYMSSSVRRYVLQLPNLVDVTSNGRFANGSDVETDFSDWDFPALTNAGLKTFCSASGSGVLSLPALRRTANATNANDSTFNNCRAEEIRISAETRAFDHLGSRTFRQCKNLKRLVIGGKPGGFTFNQDGASPTMFPDSTKLVDVVFTGGHPVFTDPSGKAFGTRDGDSGDLNMVFAHPPLDDPVYGSEWRDFLAGKTVAPLTLAERRAFKAAHPGRPVPYGVAGTDVFLTAHPQYVAVTGSEDEDLGVGLTVERDTFFDDSVTVSGAPELESGGGVYPTGSTLTLTAVPGTTGTFKRWYGDIGDNNPTNATITVTPDGDSWVYARFVHPWTVTLDNPASTSTSGTAFNGNVLINVTDVDRNAKTLTVGREEDYGLFVVERVDNGDGTVSTNMTGSGVVDLGGDFLLNGEPYAVTAYAYARSAMIPPPGSAVTTLVSPGTFAKFGGKSCFNGKPLSGIWGTVYQTVILDEPDMTTPLQDYMFGDNAVPRFVSVFPKLENWTPTAPFWNVAFSSTKLDWWDLSALSSLKPLAFHTQYLNKPEGYANNHPLYGKRLADASGTLSLPGLRTVNTDFGDNATAKGSPLMLMTGVEGIVLGGATKATTVTNIGDRAFAGDSSLRSLTIHSDADLVVGTGLFDDQWGMDAYGTARGADGRVPETMFFTGVAPNNDVFANLLERVGPKDRPVQVFVKHYDATWRRASYLNEPTTAEKRLYDGDPDFVFGVYRGTLFGFSYAKAIFIQRDFKKTTFVIFR